MINREISLNETECIEQYLNNKYDIVQTATENPGQCLNQTHVSDLVGWFTGDSLNITNNEWRDISGANNHGIVSGSGIQLFDGGQVANEFYLNGLKVVKGTTSTKILFKPMIIPQHTIFSVCKYWISGTKRRIIQAESYDARFGFYNSRSGVAYEPNGFITSNTDRFGSSFYIITIS